MNVRHVINSLIIVVATCWAVPSAFAEVQEYVRDYTYQGTNYDTAATCRVNAVDGVKHELLQEIGTYVGAVMKLHQDSLGNSYMSQDVINITAGIVAMKVLDEKWRQPQYFIKAGMKADPDDVLVKLKAMRADLELEKSLRESYEELQNSRNEVARLKAQLDQFMLARNVPTIIKTPVPETVSEPFVKPTVAITQLSPTVEPAARLSPKPNEAKPVEQPPLESVVVEEVQPKQLTTAPLPPAQQTNVVTKSPSDPQVAQLIKQYVNAVQDVEVGTAFQRAMSARLRGDFSAMFSEMSALAEKDYPQAQYRLGWLYERGLGVVQDHVKAREWYAKAIANGDGDAIARTGVLYELGLGVEKDYGKAADYYQQAIRANSAAGYVHMGYLYETGKGLTRDRVKAAEHYQRGVDMGSHLAEARLGFLYQSGRGVAQDEVKAVKLYQQAVDHGQPLAMTRLGQMYNLGHGGLPEDHVKAMALIRESVRYNLPAAYAYMGYMYEKGWEVKQDYAEAKRWYEKAAALDAPFAEKQLGLLYKNGLGVQKNRQQAIYWLERAASKGADKADEIVSRMKQRN
ncbi:MAG: hypothetical protein WCI39_00590 [Gallionellaceae bacterium]